MLTPTLSQSDEKPSFGPRQDQSCGDSFWPSTWLEAGSGHNEGFPGDTKHGKHHKTLGTRKVRKSL